MALPRLPPLDEFIHMPNAREYFEKLPWPFQQEILKQLKQLWNLMEGASNIPANPVEMALKHPKFKWMDSKHIHFLGEKVAETIDAKGALAVSEPPQHAKSSVCSVWTPFWFLAGDPEGGILHVSYGEKFGRRWGYQVRNLVQTYGKEYGLELDPKRAASDEWYLTSGGGMSCTGVGGSIGGRYVRLLIVDDAIKDWQEAQSEIVRETMWEWWEGTVEQRIQPDTAVILIGTRYREDDLIGRVLKKAKEKGGRQFEVISFPAKAKENDPLGRAPGEGLWLANKHGGQAWYDMMEATTAPHVYSAVHQQEPSPPGGNMVDPTWWRYYRISETPATFDKVIQTWDLSLDSVKKADSYHCGFVLGLKGALVYVLDVFREHCDITKVEEKILTWNARYKTRIKLVERYASGTALVQSMRARCSGLVTWPPKGHHKGSKESCLDAIIPDIRSGNVMLQINWDGIKPKWTQELIEELRQFPRGSHDDQVDALSQGVSFLLPSARGAVSKAHAEALTHGSAPTPVAIHQQVLQSSIKKMMEPRLQAMRAVQERTGTVGGPAPLLPFEKQGRRLRRMW